MMTTGKSSYKKVGRNYQILLIIDYNIAGLINNSSRIMRYTPREIPSADEEHIKSDLLIWLIKKYIYEKYAI